METEAEERPWGRWAVLHRGNGYKVKRLEVHPGHRLSYQTHSHRAEHWVVIEGIATCTIDGERVIAHPGSALTVPVGAAHRIANEGAVDLLVIVEVQLGAYTEEDDIVRLTDDYDRHRESVEES